VNIGGWRLTPKKFVLGVCFYIEIWLCSAGEKFAKARSAYSFFALGLDYFLGSVLRLYSLLGHESFEYGKACVLF